MLLARGEVARGVLALLGLWLCACRIAPDQVHWLEAHGDVIVLDIAASPRGVEGIGLSRLVYHYPGEWALPWPERAPIASVHVAASPRALYLVDEAGKVWRVAVPGKPVRWDFSQSWQVTDIAADESDRLFVLSQKRAARVDGEKLVPLGCGDQVAKKLSASRGGAYVVSDNGKLWLASDSGCQSVKVPGKVTSVAAYRDKLAVVSRGIAHVRRQGRWHALPPPEVYRETGRSYAKVETVSLSQNTLWAKSREGYVFMLSDSP